MFLKKDKILDAPFCSHKEKKEERKKKIQTNNTNFSGQLVKDERENNSEPNHAGQGPSVELKISTKNMINNKSHFPNFLSFGFSISVLERFFL